MLNLPKQLCFIYCAKWFGALGLDLVECLPLKWEWLGHRLVHFFLK